jgi:hypothetical protein
MNKKRLNENTKLSKDAQELLYTMVIPNALGEDWGSFPNEKDLLKISKLNEDNFEYALDDLILDFSDDEEFDGLFEIKDLFEEKGLKGIKNEINNIFGLKESKYTKDDVMNILKKNLSKKLKKYVSSIDCWTNKRYDYVLIDIFIDNEEIYYQIDFYDNQILRVKPNSNFLGSFNEDDIEFIEDEIYSDVMRYVKLDDWGI